MKGQLKPCGTPAAYKRHIAAGEEACEPCRKAKHAYGRAWREKVRSQGLDRKPTLHERLLAFVIVNPDTGCWEWSGTHDRDGYGRISVKGRLVRAYRVAYELIEGPIPTGMELDHRCHTEDASCRGGRSCPHRRCVNPAHLEPVTPAENNQRGRSPSARNALKTHCIHGHEFTPENTYWFRSARHCRACNRENARKSKARRRGAAS